MESEVLSESSSTIGDDWVKDANGSGSADSSSVRDVVDVLKEFSSVEGSPVQKESELQARKWIRLLGMANRPDPLSDWDQLYNLKSQSQLRNDCRILAKQTGNTKSVPELESFLTLYCKKRNMDYDKDSGWTLHLFNIFFGLTTKYMPRETKPGAQVFDLFRLLLQYHEPELSSHLESIKCSPHTYTRTWFASPCLRKRDGDPFLVFFLALAMTINAKEQLLAYTKDQREEAVKLLSELPKPDDLNTAIEAMLPTSYFVIDCRSEEAFRAGQVHGSFNLDAQLFVDAPEHFAMAHKAQEEYKSAQHPEDHYCFLGYGDPEKTNL
ncbi:unnamed protein product, partial [Mesorhabditis spiculigera]